MQENNINKRISLAIDMLSEMKAIYSQLRQLTSDVEEYSGSLYEKLFIDGKSAIQDRIDKYNENISMISRINTDITAKINGWYEFAKNPGQMKKVLFPLRFRIKKKNLLTSIKKANKKIEEITINNRFIKEQLANWEQDLEVKAIQQIKCGDDFTGYEKLIARKDQLLAELKYLLPTIPGICPIELDMDNIENAVDKLKAAAS